VPNYKKIQLIAYGVVTSAPTGVLQGTGPNRFQEDAELRAQRLCDVADFVATNYASAIADPQTLKVFVAPEFYFRYGGPSDPPEALNDSYPNGEILLPNVNDKILRPHFANDAFADWLIVAGTMFWHKSAADSNAAHPTYFNTVLALRGGPDTELTAEERAANGNPMNVPTMGASSTNQKALMSWIDYSGSRDLGSLDWDAAINPMFKPILGDHQWWRWHMFHAHGVNGPDGAPLVFGLEVCLEHVQAYASAQPDAGVLRTLRTRYPSLSEIDVHIVSSCGMELDPASGIEARVDGFALICDGAQPDPRVATPPWPAAEHELVTAIRQNNLHATGPAALPLHTTVLPANLQLGNHNPKDAVSVWSPAPLSY
jgi:hypothetical protein